MTSEGIDQQLYAVPGTTVQVGLYRSPEGTWHYTLYDYADGNPKPAGTGTVDLPTEYATPSQVARIAFLLEVEYPHA